MTKIDKNKLYGSPTTKELKKKHLFRLVGGVEMGSWRGEDWKQGSSWRNSLHADKLGRTAGEQDRQHNLGFQCGKRKPQNLCCKNVLGLRW